MLQSFQYNFLSKEDYKKQFGNYDPRENEEDVDEEGKEITIIYGDKYREDDDTNNFEEIKLNK